MTNIEAPEQIDPHTRLSRSDSLLYSQVDDDVTMMSVETGKYYGLSSVGARIWGLLESPASAEEICDRLVREYRVDRQRCEREVLSVLRHMAAEGVVTVTVPVPPSGE